jgi:O-antigen ligase
LIATVGLQALAKSPILGFGQENFEIAIESWKMHTVDNAHNIFLETAVASGIVGLLIFLAIIFVAFRNANFTIRMALLAFLIVAQFNPLSITEIMLFWFLLAISKV